jgi:hypothetical protein
MTKYQKAAALTIRLASVGLILYTVIGSISAALMMPQAIWIMVPPLVAGVILFLFAIPLGCYTALGIEE